MERNGIETIPGGDIFIGLRTYGPEKTVLDGTYKIPRFELVEQARRCGDEDRAWPQPAAVFLL